MDITASAQWSELAKVYEDKKDLNLRELFAADADRARNFTFDAAGLHVDLSKNLVDEDILKALVALAEEADLKGATEKMFTGEHINSTEDRAVLHTALRIPAEQDLSVDGQDVAGRLERANACGALACTAPGDWEGAPDGATLEAFLHGGEADPVSR